MRSLSSSSIRRHWHGRSRGRSVRLLRVSTFHKILLANIVLVLGIVVISTALATRFLGITSGGSAFGVFLLIALTTAAASIPIHAAILRLALAPIQVLEDTAERVEGGDLNARAELSPLADPRLARLTEVFNRLLDAMISDRWRLRDVAARAFRAQEAERARLARELQGETAQTLSAVLLHLRVVRRTPDAEVRNALLDELRDAIAGITERVNRFASGLHAPALKELGIVAAVEGYVRVVTANERLEVDLHADELRGVLSAEQELALYRVMQEALSNVVRHASATELRVRFDCRSEEVEALVEDNGCGFVIGEEEARHPCLGIFGMRERALYAGGSAEIESEPGRGTRVRVRMPFPSTNGKDKLHPRFVA